MISRFALAVLLLSPAFAAPANKMEETVELLKSQALASNAAHEITASLTTEVGPRIAGSEAEARARSWAMRTLKARGFKTVWMQTTEMNGWYRVKEEATIEGEYAQKLAVTALGGSVSTPIDGIRAELVRFENYAALKAYTGRLDGKIAYIANRMDRTATGEGYGLAVVARAIGASEAARKGAQALIIRSIGTDDDRMPHTGTMRYDEEAAKIPAAALSNPDADQIDRLIAMGKQVTVKLNLETRDPGKLTTGNVIAEVKGREKPDQILVVGGHLDSWDLGTGAIDDGTGIGITMAAVELINRLPKPPRRSIRFVAWGDEERTGSGADAYVAQEMPRLGKHVLAGESDFGDGRVMSVDFKMGPKAEAVKAAIVKALEPLGIVKGKDDRAGGADIADMIKEGVPGIALNQDGTKYFDLHHTANDTLDKVDPDALKQNVAAWAAALYIAAEWPDDYR